MNKNDSFETGKNKRSKKAVIFDLDGTLADIKDYEALHKINSDEFRQAAGHADAYPHMVALAKKAKQQGRDVIVLTARSAHYRSDTKNWLHNMGFPMTSYTCALSTMTTKIKKSRRTFFRSRYCLILMSRRPTTIRRRMLKCIVRKA